MIFEIIKIIEIFITLQCTLFSLYLFTTNSGKTLRNRILGAFLLALGLQMILLTLLNSGNIYVYRTLLSFRFIFGPLLYFYVRSITEKDFRLDFICLIHMIPFLLMLILLNLFNVTLNRVYLLGLINLSVIGYLSASYFRIIKYQTIVKEVQSSYSALSLNWLKQLIALLTIPSVINFINNTLYKETYWPFDIMILAEILMIFVLINTIVFKALRNPVLFSGVSKEDVQIAEDVKQKYVSSSLNSDDLQKYKKLLDTFMITEKPYLNPDLSLEDLSEKLSISRRDLSQLINTQFDKNFSEYINEFRIEYAVKIFNESDDKKMTVLEVLYEVGFNSKSSFYTSFKKKMNMTPKEYRSKIK